MDSMIQHVLVTGGAGYLGSVLTHKLIAPGYDVTVVDNLSSSTTSLLDLVYEPSFTCEVLDIRYPSLISPLLDESDVVVHLAATGGENTGAGNVEETKHINLGATKAINEESCRRGVKRFILASTCSNYAAKHTGEPVDETGELTPQSPYGVTKMAAEEFILGNPYPGTVATILRFSEIHGISHHNRFDLTLNKLIREAVKNERVEMPGEEDSWRPYVHVRDACGAIVAVIEADEGLVNGQVFNVGDDTQNFRMNDVAGKITGVMPDVRCVFRPSGNNPRSYRIGFGKIKRELGFSTKYRLEDGITELSGAILEGMAG